MKESGTATGRYLNKWLYGVHTYVRRSCSISLLCGNTSSYKFFQLDSQAFSNLNVKKHNYSEVDKLYLDNNQLDSLPEKLLKMRLKVRFSARNNKLTTVSILYTIIINSLH